MKLPMFSAAMVLASIARLLAVPLTLTTPVNYQVFQRYSKTAGTLLFSGHVDEGREADFEARLIAGGKAGVWKKVVPVITDHQFEGTIEAEAGGWHRLEVRVSRAGKVLGEAVVEHVGVGEVFVVAGQSNSANHGEEKQSPQSARVAAFDGRAWRLAADPQPGASGGGGSFLPPFGDAMVQRFEVPVGFIACGIGATSVREWLPKGSQFPNPPTLTSRVQQRPDGKWESKGEAYAMFVERMKLGAPRGFRAVLWHQGESDANQADPTRTLPGNLYREYLEMVIRESRREIGCAAPWFVAQVSYHVPGDEASPDIRAAQASLWKDGIALEGPDSDALKGDLRENGGKGVHFSGPGLRAQAARWGEKVGPWLEQELARALPVTGAILDLAADRGVTASADNRVTLWQNQASGFPAMDFVHRDEGRAEPGSGRPTLLKAVKAINGRSAIEFRQQELVCMDEDAFDFLSRGAGCTWLTVIAPQVQREGLKDVNSFFGNLKNSGNYEGLWGCLNDDNTVWWGLRNGLTFGRFDENNPQLTGPKLETGKFVILAGRLRSGTGNLAAELFVNSPQPVATAQVPVNPQANPSRMAIGQERDAIQHPGHESFDGQIARFLIFPRPLSDPELDAVIRHLGEYYGLR